MTDSNRTCAAIMAAGSEGEVLTLVRKYLASLGAEKAALIPSSVISLGISHARELAQAAVEVASREAEALADGPEAALFREVGTVLSTAAMKLVVLGCGEPAQTAEG